MWATRFIPLIIHIDDKGQVEVCTDGAHAVHADGKVCSEMFLAMDKGAMMSVSKKLGVIIVGSTET